MRKIASLILTASLLIWFNTVTAQKVDSILSIYSDNYQQEKVHLHFDKSIYAKGETVWFKAYIMSGIDLSDYSRNFYVDWFDMEGKLIQHTSAPIYESSAKGQFVIPANYTGKMVHAKAYTQWMLNFDTAFLYNKDIRVDQPVSSKAVVAEKPAASIQFFPEGGDLVNGLNSRIAFLVNNQFGKPVSARGAIKNSKGALIDSFATEHDGMGSVAIDAVAGEVFTASWVDEFGVAHTTPLPAAKSTGVVLQVQALQNKAVFVARRTENIADNFKMMYVVGTLNQHLVYRSRVNFSKSSVLGEIPTAALPSGILQITLFDANWVPIAERITFINNHQYQFTPEIKTITKGVEKRARNIIEVSVSDTVLSNMSISVTDAGLFNDTSSNIVSQLLLSGDIKGYIHNPAYYFSSDADSIRDHLELVMLTHGWRRYKWDDIVQGKMPKLTYSRDSDYLQIKGKVFGNAFARNKNAQLINLILQAKDSSKQMLFLPVDKAGDFVQRGAIFFDTIKVYYQFNGEKRLTDIAEVRFQNGLMSPPAKVINRLNATPSFFLDTAAMERSRFFATQKDKLDKALKAAQLDEVTVRTRAKSAKDVLDEKYTSGLFSGGDGYQFDVMNDPIAQSALDVFSYLQGRVAGLQISMANGEPTLSWRGGTPDLFLDEIRADVDQLRTIPMTDVAYLKVFRPPFFGAFGGGSGGAIAVYTRKGGDQKFTPGQGLGFSLLAGYTPYKEFYNPNYSISQTAQPDVRTTLYWNPYILTDGKSKSVKVEFYNNDVSKRLRIVLEGVNLDGKLARVEKIIE